MKPRATGDAKETPRKQFIGGMLLKSGLITEDQLKQALKRQAQVGGHLGSTLIQMGLLEVEDLLKMLAKQRHVPAVNLFKLNIRPEVIASLPPSKIEALHILPLAVDAHTMTLAMESPHDIVTISELEFTLRKKIKPVLVPSFIMQAAVCCVLAAPGKAFVGEQVRKSLEADQTCALPASRLQPLLRYAVQSGASDMLLTAGAPPSVRITSQLSRLAMASLTPEDCESYAREMIPPDQWEEFVRNQEYDAAVNLADIGRFRVNAYRQRHSISIAIRPVIENIPPLADLHLPDWLADFALRPQGLILVVGPAGQGKSTTLTAMIDIINTRRRCNILTLEDPIEYLHPHKKSNVNQREVGRDTDSFYHGLRHVFRQSPDVIVIGEMRDKDSFQIALQAASTGHLVMTTVHGDNTTSIIERVVNMFEPHQQNLIRQMLANCLLLSVSQRLVTRRTGKGRIMALEKLVATNRVRNLIREQKTHQIRSQMQAGTEDFQSLDLALGALVNGGQIDLDQALPHAEDESFIRDLVAGGTRRKTTPLR